MVGLEDLKERIHITKKTVECPLKGCPEKVERQRQSFKREERFRCPVHEIYISPSTFEYPQQEDNLLWKQNDDLRLLERIKAVKRESRMARDNSEDAVTWNVFRFLERNNLTGGFLDLIGAAVEYPEIIYWSYSQQEDDIWAELEKARKEFGEAKKRSSEPDIIIKTEKALVFIEAKLTATNETSPSDKSNSKKYETGGNYWFKEVFTSDYKTIAIIDQKYELMRFWLLGTWIAFQMDMNFYLINLILSGKEEDIEVLFKRHIRESLRRKFLRLTWEDIYQYIKTKPTSKDNSTMLRYFATKSLGYDSNGMLKKAFRT
jgi:hypothetical protein